MAYTDSDWLRILTGMGVRAVTAAKWSHPFADEVQPEKFSRGEADLVDWLPQILHESTGTNTETGTYGPLERMEECLSYTPERLVVVWPNRFPNTAAALPFMHLPQKLANFVYANRMGNGDVSSGDGWMYRGRGPIQLTGRAAYAHVGDLVGQDLIGVPDLVAEPRFGLQIAIHWWEDRIPDSMLSDQAEIRKRVNGSTLGLPQVIALRDKLTEILA